MQEVQNRQMLQIQGMNMIKVRLTLLQELQQTMDFTEEVFSVLQSLKILRVENIICHIGKVKIRQ